MARTETGWERFAEADWEGAREDQRRGDTRHAGGLAIYLAGECRIDGQDAAAAGWLARGRRLLEHEGTTRVVAVRCGRQPPTKPISSSAPLRVSARSGTPPRVPGCSRLLVLLHAVLSDRQ